MSVDVSSVKFLGHIITKEGVRPDPDKVSAINNMPTPECKQDVERLLGMVTYLGKFIPNMSELTEPLRELLKANVLWSWQKCHDQAFEKVKTVLSNAPVLHNFQPDKPITISVDASQKGLGATLLQERAPVAYASKSLTPSQ